MYFPTLKHLSILVVLAHLKKAERQTGSIMSILPLKPPVATRTIVVLTMFYKRW